jgi:hypothetical protein
VIYFKIIEANGKVEALKTKLKLGLAWVRVKNEETFVGIGAAHQNWLQETVKEYGAKVVAVTNDVIREKFREGVAKVEEYRAPCGFGPIFDKMLLSAHIRNCLKCQEIKGITVVKPKKERKPRASSVEVREVLPGMSLSVGDLLNKLKEERDAHLKIATDIDAVCSALLNYQETVEERKKAIENYEKAKYSISLILKSVEK